MNYCELWLLNGLDGEINTYENFVAGYWNSYKIMKNLALTSHSLFFYLNVKHQCTYLIQVFQCPIQRCIRCVVVMKVKGNNKN